MMNLDGAVLDDIRGGVVRSVQGRIDREQRPALAHGILVPSRPSTTVKSPAPLRLDDEVRACRSSCARSRQPEGFGVALDG